MLRVFLSAPDGYGNIRYVLSMGKMDIEGYIHNVHDLANLISLWDVENVEYV